MAKYYWKGDIKDLASIEGVTTEEITFNSKESTVAIGTTTRDLADKEWLVTGLDPKWLMYEKMSGKFTPIELKDFPELASATDQYILTDDMSTSKVRRWDANLAEHELISKHHKRTVY